LSDGVGEARVEAEGELALARLALDEDDLDHVATHLGHAIAADPSLAAVYRALDDLDDTAGGALALFPADGGVYIGTGAARSYLLARSGALDEALGLLCLVVRAQPGKPWAAPGWLTAPGLAGRLDPEQAASALTRLAIGLPDPAEPDLAARLRPFLDLARAVVVAHPDRADLAAPLSGLARRLGAADEAIAWCRDAERAGPGGPAAIMLGYALRSAGRFDEMHEAWLRALGRDPGNVALHVDIAEGLARRERRDEGLAWLDKALALAPDHPKAFPSACEMRYARDGDVAHLVRLADWWRAHPEHDYAHDMLAKACRDRPWLRLVPWPREAICNLLVRFAEQNPQPEALRRATGTVTLSALEVPSALAVFRALAPGLLVEVSGVPEPDLRIPLAEGRHRVWEYAGTVPEPAVPAPSAEAVTALRTAGARGHWAHPVAAYDAAVLLSGLALDDLLGLLGHVPPSPDDADWRRVDRRNPAYWPRFAQALTCLGLLHYRTGEPWPSSARRGVLIDLARGIEDWTTDAALNALVVAAFIDPRVRDDVAAVVGRRFLDALRARRQREVTIAWSLAHLVLATPVMHPDVTALAREFLAHEAAGAAQAPPAG
jgi:tetratricopeptide (TPR) repeat protein